MMPSDVGCRVSGSLLWVVFLFEWKMRGQLIRLDGCGVHGTRCKSGKSGVFHVSDRIPRLRDNNVVESESSQEVTLLEACKLVCA
jgi:hypothetical protein